MGRRGAWPGRLAAPRCEPPGACCPMPDHFAPPPRGHFPAWLLAILGTLAVAALFPLAAWSTVGISEAQRAATELAMPVGVAWLLVLAAAIGSAAAGQRAAALLWAGLWAAMLLL